jgi:TorA maturation chaperone TorD
MILTSIEPFKLFGALFYYRQEQKTLSMQLTALLDEGLVSTNTGEQFELMNEESYESQFLALFEGSGEMQAPPWGSVYLDREQVMFGASTLEYRSFLKANQFQVEVDNREPEDQFGLMLLAVAYLLESDKTDSAITLLEQHLLPWSSAYLKRLESNSDSPFYASLAVDAYAWLNSLTQTLELNVSSKKIYSNHG